MGYVLTTLKNVPFFNRIEGVLTLFNLKKNIEITDLQIYEQNDRATEISFKKIQTY